MGSTGARSTSAGIEAAERLMSTLEPLGDVTSRAMFGGHGIFKDDVMFAIVDSEGRVFLRADAATTPAFEAAGSTRHPRMPYWEVPAPVLAQPDELRAWTTTAAAIAVGSRR